MINNLFYLENSIFIPRIANVTTGFTDLHYPQVFKPENKTVY